MAVSELLKRRGHTVIVAATDRQLLVEILKESGVNFILFKHTKSGSRFKKLCSYLGRLKQFRSVVLQNNIDVYISKASIDTFIVKVIRKKVMTVIFPDSQHSWLTNNFVRYYADLILLSIIFPFQWPAHKVVRVNGTCENCYLDPKYLQVVTLNPQDYGYLPDSKFVFFRFVAFNASHDIGQYGFTKNQRVELVKLFVAFGYTPLISFEDEPDSELIEHINRFPKSKIRSVLLLCEYFVGDSQSMAAESALLGLKSFRYNSWVLDDSINFKYFNHKKLLLNYACFDKLKDDLVRSLEGKLDFFQPVAGYWEECEDVNTTICDVIEKRFKSFSLR
jgi:predicted glycosyltransferase